jgi:hypothetical protein
MEPIGCPETSVQNYHSALRNIPEEGRSHLHCGGSLKSRKPENVRKVKHFWRVRVTMSSTGTMVTLPTIIIVSKNVITNSLSASCKLCYFCSILTKIEKCGWNVAKFLTWIFTKIHPAATEVSNANMADMEKTTADFCNCFAIVL